MTAAAKENAGRPPASRMGRSSYTRCSTGPSGYIKARIAPQIENEHITTCMYTLVTDLFKRIVQGTGAVRGEPSTSRGETSYSRAPQASSLTHPNAIIVEHHFYSQAYCSVGLWCMCPMSGGTQSGPTGWEMNGVYKMGQRNKRTHKVTPLYPQMQICDLFRRRPHGSPQQTRGL